MDKIEDLREQNKSLKEKVTKEERESDKWRSKQRKRK